MKKDIVAGIGEIGKPILKLLSKHGVVVGFDSNPDLMDERKFEKYESLKTSFLHIAIPVTGKFINNVLKLYKKFQPECIVIHSTIKPGMTEKLQEKLSIPVIYSATRGVHKRMVYDLKRYTKFFVISANAPRGKWATTRYAQSMKRCGVKTKKMSKPETLELAKIICDTSYLGWLVNYAQLSNVIAIEHGVDYDEMWSFSDEIQEFLGNRPKMYPSFIGGHCVIPNLNLINNESLNIISKMNNRYAKKLKKEKK
jgi:UDP-N-acetyl-D-mannosaminuronate dehydrogenase|tara:strand:+ start:2927 stop:3688 length:762 start_codon:yes stop_codon:yes gene_type:complete